jgi:hypothetical protein
MCAANIIDVENIKTKLAEMLILPLDHSETAPTAYIFWH